MSVTVSDLLKLPSLQQARVLGGAGGLCKVVSSISVLESIDPEVLVSEVFPSGKYAGSEIVITGFLNCTRDVELQCANIRRLIEGGEVGMVLYYVGIYLPQVDQRLIDLADAHDFVLISMPEGQGHLRYSDLIADVTECIYRDRWSNLSLVSDILARISSLPRHHQTVDTAIQMLSAELSCTVVLTTHEGEILNLATWPRGMDEAIRQGIETYLPAFGRKEELPCPFLPDARLFCLPIRSDLAQPFQLILIKSASSFSSYLLEQAVNTVRICINIWGRQHGRVAIHELLRAILQDEPLTMRRLAEIFQVDETSLHELWILYGVQMEEGERQREEQMEDWISRVEQCAQTVIGAIYEGLPILCLSTPSSLREAERVMEELLSIAGKNPSEAVILRCGGLQNTSSCRSAYLLAQEHLASLKRIFPRRRCFLLGDLEFAASCTKSISQGENVAVRQTLPLAALQADGESSLLLDTVCTYLLDCNGSITRTAELLFLHKNTIKYRLQRIGDLLGYRIGKMPEMIELNRSAVIYRLLHAGREGMPRSGRET